MSTNVILAGVGGQGAVLASKLLARAAMERGLSVKTAETIGMAQRGGSVTSHVRIGGPSRVPVSPLIGRGRADAIVAFEPAEAVRQLPFLRPGGMVVTSDAPVVPVSAATGGPAYDLPAIMSHLHERVGEKNLVVYHPDKEVEHIFYDYLHAPRLTEADPRELMRHERITQITPFFTEAIEQEVMPLIPGCISGRWYPAFCDITAIGSDKGNGIRHIAKQVGFGIEETMAFGDGGNDISMIKVAGIGVAMGNANESLKPVADYITSSVDEDGVEKAMREFGVISSEL